MIRMQRQKLTFFDIILLTLIAMSSHQEEKMAHFLVNISEELATFTGLEADECEYSRDDVIELVYGYIDMRRLYNKYDPRFIDCDEKLGKLLNYDPNNPPDDENGMPELLNYDTLQKYLRPHFTQRKQRMEKKMKSSCGHKSPCPNPPRLRRCFAICPNSVDQEMKLAFLDLESKSNADICATTRCFRRQTYHHPRARQLAAACRYGWVITPAEAYMPEEFMSRLSDATLRFEEKCRNEERDK